jgi:Tfp pilus assembly protein PilN
MIVIITEVLVLGAFGWRFWLDRKLNDLKEEIENKGEVLKSLSSQEEEIRNLQSKIDVYRDLWSASSNYSPIVQEVNSYIPSDTEDLTVSISQTNEGKTLAVSGEVDRESISALENSLKDSASFSDVALAAIERRGEGEDVYSFTLLVKIVLAEERESLSQNAITESQT